MASQLEIIRARLKQDDDRKTGGANRTSNQDKTIYPFWNIAENVTSAVRFLRDKDTTNPYFWVERLMINLPFPSIKGQPSSKPVTVKVPCMEMYGEVDPIITETKPWWDIPEFVDQARIYWKNRSYLFQ